MNRSIVYFFVVICTVAVAQIVSAQDTIPIPVPDSQEFTGPITEALERLVTKHRVEDKQEMAGLLDRLRQRDDTTAKEFASLRDWFHAREESESQRYHGIRGMLEKILDRPQLDTTGLFPRIAELRSDVKAVRDAQAEMGTGPIREALGMLTSLVYGLILLAGVLLMVDVYRTFFRKA